jgi:hypothetical protein
MPELVTCANCGQPAAAQARAFFAPSAGGVVCRNCEASFPHRVEIDPRLLRIAQSISAAPDNGQPRRLPILTRHQTDPINRMLAEHLQYASGKRLRLARYAVS